MFEIATQYNAIFRAQTNAKQMSVSLLSMWTSRRVHSFLSMLGIQLNRMEDSASLRDALDACVFFSASMGRLGADFTAQLPPLFESKMHALVVHFWREGASQLAEALKICREAGVASPLSSSTVAAPTPSDAATGDLDEGPLPPPRQLMALPPLGRLVNAFLTGLNELRRCLLPGILSRLRESLDEVLTEVENILQANERAVMTPGLRGDAKQLRAIAKEMREVMSEVVVPYVRGAVETSLGNEVAAKEFFDQLAANLEDEEEMEKEEYEKDDTETEAEGTKEAGMDDTAGDGLSNMDTE